jgi:DNA-binding XRE family transcriptional regulator
MSKKEKHGIFSLCVVVTDIFEQYIGTERRSSNDQAKVGSFLKALRNEKNLTQETLAEQLGVSNRTVSRWETGSNMPDIGMVVEIA